MMLGLSLLIALLYLRLAWSFKIVPSICLSPGFQLLFYPAVTLPDIANAFSIQQWVVGFSWSGPILSHQLWQQSFYVACFSSGRRREPLVAASI